MGIWRSGTHSGDGCGGHCCDRWRRPRSGLDISNGCRLANLLLRTSEEILVNELFGYRILKRLHKSTFISPLMNA